MRKISDSLSIPSGLLSDVWCAAWSAALWSCPLPPATSWMGGWWRGGRCRRPQRAYAFPLNKKKGLKCWWTRGPVLAKLTGIAGQALSKLLAVTSAKFCFAHEGKQDWIEFSCRFEVITTLCGDIKLTHAFRSASSSFRRWRSRSRAPANASFKPPLLQKYNHALWRHTLQKVIQRERERKRTLVLKVFLEGMPTWSPLPDKMSCPSSSQRRLFRGIILSCTWSGTTGSHIVKAGAVEVAVFTLFCSAL